ncbi:hypothetical protein [Paraburkholderia dipogonis]|uniref:hypothetical protein n=1 Tax=Paraburkholderia dipogonis TaxID=1211383 RepID=UPI0038BE1236
MGPLMQCDTKTGRLCRSVHRRRENRFESTTGELIALARAHGAEPPGDNHVNAAHHG